MRKHKSVVAILLAVMMIFTFMPTMAFAGTNTSTVIKSWSDKMATVTDNNGDTFNTTRDFMQANAYIKTDATDNSPVVGKKAPSSSAYFYDFDSSMLVYGGNGSTTKGTKLDGTTWENSTFTSTNTIYLLMSQPDYDTATPAQFNHIALTKAASANTDGTYNWTGKTADGKYTVVAKQSKYDSDKQFEEQTVKFDVEITPTSEFTVDGTLNGPAMFGKPESASITVKAAKKDLSNAKIFIDSFDNNLANQSCLVNGSGTLTGLYDGAAHKVVAEAVEGYTVSYKVLDRATNLYKDGEVSITDVPETGKEIKFQVIYTKNNVPEVYTHTLTLTGANGVFFGWDDDQNLEDLPKVKYSVGGSEYDGNSYVVPGFTKADETVADEATRKANIASNTAKTAAISANESLLKEYFAAKYEVNAKTYKSDLNKVTLSIAEQKLTTAESTAVAEKYASLLRNFGGSIGKSVVTADLEINADAVVDDEIEFTSAVTSKVYKGSKTTKKGKLKKNQSFTVKAVSNAGKTVYYKLVNANTPKIVINKTTGKITVKKGLTKGTYKFQVKAYTTSKGGSDKLTAEYQTITVKIKK